MVNQYKNQNTGEINRLVNTTMNESQILKEAAGIGTISHQNHRLQTVRMRVLCRNMICTVKQQSTFVNIDKNYYFLFSMLIKVKSIQKIQHWIQEDLPKNILSNQVSTIKIMEIY